MPSGFRQDTDGWVREYEEAKLLEQETLQLIQERDACGSSSNPEASRKTASARKKIGTLGTIIDKLLRFLDSSEAQTLSEQEKNRRRDLLYGLRGRREQMQHSLRRSRDPMDREKLLRGGSSSYQPTETEQTAELDNQGILGLQQQMMQNQDVNLGNMEKSVKSTKHIALAIGEEVDLQTRLLEDVEDDVEVTQSRMKAVTQKVKHMMKDNSHCKGGFIIFLLIIVLVVVLLLISKIGHLFLLI